jgi:hypothetical protein
MKGSLGLVVVGVMAGLVALGIAHAQAPLGPGPGPGSEARLRDPFQESISPMPANPGPANPLPVPAPVLPSTPGAVPGFASGNLQSAGPGRPFPPFQESPDPNADIRVTPEHGLWLICVHWYSGPDAPMMARQMVEELRTNYKMPAFVFNHGTEERRKEYERVKAVIEEKRKLYQDFNAVMPIRVGHRKIEEQVAVLVGGYRDDSAARRELDRIRKLPPPDPRRVKLTGKFYGTLDGQNPQTGQFSRGEYVLVNPFHTAFVVRNPSIKNERPTEWDRPDMTLLRKLNRDESFSLLKCTKPVTLVIREFMTPTAVQPKSAGSKFLESLGLGKSEVDASAQNAHNLADLLRKNAKLDAYVLHTRFSSLVTVGGFDGAEDPRLRSMQHMLTEQLKIPSAMPMQVPR